MLPTDPTPPVNSVPADDNRGDRRQLPADGAGWGSGERQRREKDSGQPSQRPAHGVDHNQGASDRDSCQTCRFLVAADGQHVSTEPGSIEEQGAEDVEHGR